MRVIMVSGGVLAVAAVFGLGVVVGRFVLSRDVAAVSAPTNAIMGPSGLDNPLGDPNAALSADPSLNALPPAPSAPLPPALPPGYAQSGAQPGSGAASISARAASDAAMAASEVTAACNIRVSQDTPIRTWAQKDRVSIVAIGETCATATIRISLETPESASLYSLQANARDFGIAPDASADDVRARLSQIIPTNSVRAAAYPQWSSDAAAPAGSEFTREGYEAVRAANLPVTCLRIPNAAQRCFAVDPSNGQLKVFARS